MSTEAANIEPANAVAEYKERYCAFIDILGFKNGIGEGDPVKNWKPSDIVNLLNSIHEVHSHNEQLLYVMDTINKGEAHYQVTHFSDSIIMSIEPQFYAFSYIVIIISALAVRLQEYGVLLRGGITKGKMFHGDKQVFGPAVNRAYSLEKQAIYPRVILDHHVSEEIDALDVSKSSNKADKILRKWFCEHYIQEDSDGWRYVDYLFGSPDKLRALIGQHRKSDTIDLRTKYGWLEKRLEEALLHRTKEPALGGLASTYRA